MIADDVSGPARGRPRIFTDTTLGQAADFSYARQIRTRRGAQDLVYRMFAVAVLDHYREAFPEKGAALDWLLGPPRRHTLLSELGRIAQPRSDERGDLRWSEQGVGRLVEAAFVVAGARPSTKDGVDMIRRLRRELRSVVS